MHGSIALIKLTVGLTITVLSEIRVKMIKRICNFEEQKAIGWLSLDSAIKISTHIIDNHTVTNVYLFNNL